MMNRWLAEEFVTWAFPDGRREGGRIAIGAPELAPGGETDCTYAIDGLEHVAGPVKGSGPMQALCIALRFIGWRLHDFVSSGGRVLNDDGEDVALEAIFGPLIAKRPSTDSADDRPTTPRPG